MTIHLLSLAEKLHEDEVPGIVLFLAFYIPAMILLGIMEYLKEHRDRITYKEVISLSKSDVHERDGISCTRRHLLVAAWGKFAVCAIAGATIDIVAVRLCS